MDQFKTQPKAEVIPDANKMRRTESIHSTKKKKNRINTGLPEKSDLIGNEIVTEPFKFHLKLFHIKYYLD